MPDIGKRGGKGREGTKGLREERVGQEGRGEERGGRRRGRERGREGREGREEGREGEREGGPEEMTRGVGRVV